MPKSQSHELHRKNCIVTGASRGIGYSTSLWLAKRGCRTILGCRGEQCKKAESDLLQQGLDVTSIELDVRSPKSVDLFTQRVRLIANGRVDVLVNNAGVARFAFGKMKMWFGLEDGLVTNSIGPWCVTEKLKGMLRKSSGIGNGNKAVVVTVASKAQRYGRMSCLERLRVPPVGNERWSVGFMDYGDSKLLNFLFATGLKERGEVISIAFHPGLVKTDFFRSNWALESLINMWPLARDADTVGKEIADVVCNSESGYFAERGRRAKTRGWGDVEGAKAFQEKAENVVKYLEDRGV